MEPTKLSVEATDKLILDASRSEDGAIEDCEERDDTVVYFFSSGAVGEVRRDSGAVTIKQAEDVQ